MSQHEDALAALDPEPPVHIETSVVGVITKSEVEAQLTAAHRYPRNPTRFLKEAMTLATITQEVADSCIYSLPRDGKFITGPSVRLAEIAASAYGNMHVGARIVEEGEKDITAQGVAWDIEKNVRVTVENKRRITGRNGRRFSDDMVVMTGNAAASIALRNAIFRVIPRSYILVIYEEAKKVAVGTAKTLEARRAQVIERFAKLGVSQDRLLKALDKHGVQDIGLEELEILIGMGTAIKNGDKRIEELFPVAAPAPAAPAEDGKRISLKGAKKAEPEPEAPPEEAPPEAREPGED